MWNCIQTDINKRKITNWNEKSKNRAEWETLSRRRRCALDGSAIEKEEKKEDNDRCTVNLDIRPFHFLIPIQNNFTRTIQYVFQFVVLEMKFQRRGIWHDLENLPQSRCLRKKAYVSQTRSSDGDGGNRIIALVELKHEHLVQRCVINLNLCCQSQ